MSKVIRDVENSPHSLINHKHNAKSVLPFGLSTKPAKLSADLGQAAPQDFDRRRR
jgi:hypothetical protein